MKNIGFNNFLFRNSKINTDEEFLGKLHYLNYIRAKYICPPFLVVLLAGIIYDLTLGQSDPSRFRTTFVPALHIGAFLLLIPVSLILYIHPARSVTKFRHRLAAYTEIIIFALIVVPLMIIRTIEEPRASEHYTILVLSLSVILLLRPYKSLLLYLSLFLATSVFMFYVVEEANDRFSNLLNLSTVTIIGLIVSHSLYTGFRKNHFHSRTIEKQNTAIQDMLNRIRHSQTEYQQLFNNLPIGVFRISIKGEVLSANKAFLNNLGFDSLESLNEVGIENLYASNNDHNRIREIIKNKPITRFETDFQRKDGEIVSMSINGHLVFSDKGKPTSLEGTTEDITKRKQSEKKLNESRQRLEDIIDFLPLATMVIDSEGKVTAWNKKMEEVTRMKREDILGKGNYEYALPFYKERRPILIDYVLKPQEIPIDAYMDITQEDGNGGILRAETSVPDFPGKTDFTLVGYARALFDGEGNPAGAIESLRDITIRRKAEKELNEAKDAAEAATRTKSQFLANMSHEIRTPMNAIIGMTQLAQQNTTDPRQQDYLFKIGRAADNLLLIINDILDFSKIEAGKLSIEKIPFFLNEVLSNLSTVVSLRAQEKGLEFIFDIEGNLPKTLIGDPLRLNQILINLCANSIKFTDRGEIIVHIKHLETIGTTVRLEFSISDTGIGMNKEQIGRLFQAFSQADTSTTRKYGGTGLGLSISHRLVSMMDGTFSVQSEEEKGSTFTFTALFGIVEKEEGPTQETEISFTGIRALVTDDNDSARTILSKQLSMLGFDTSSAKSGEDAIKLLKSAHSKNNPFSLVLMDCVMPGMDGIETGRKIKASSKVGNNLKMIMTTAYGNDDIFQEARNIGFDGFLIKPISNSSMHDTVMNVFGNKKQKRKMRKRDPYYMVRNIRGARILLAEDNEMNQELAVTILKDAGFSVILANDGLEAVEKMDDRFHAVLMDIQMPRMDGYEAARKIRSQQEFDGIPIIAMTADAMDEDRQKTKEAGMVDHIPKPIDLKKLFHILAEWIQPNPEKPFETQPHLEGLNPVGDSIVLPTKIPGLNVKAGLDLLAGNRRAYKRVLLQFAENDHLLSNMLESIQQKDRSGAVRAAHSLKGIAGSLGAKELSSTAAEVETVLKLKAETPELLNRLTQQFNKVHEALKKWALDSPINKPDDFDTGSMDLAAWFKSLEELKTLAEEDDVRAMEVCETIEGYSPWEYHGKIEEIYKALRILDFTAALELIESIMKNRTENHV